VLFGGTRVDCDSEVVDSEKQIDILVGGNPLLDRESSEAMRQRMKLRIIKDPTTLGLDDVKTAAD
jgi:hypothetical protein